MYSILVPLDGSELSERARNLAIKLARSIGGEIKLVTVIEGSEYGHEAPDREQEAAEDYLVHAARHIPDDVPYTTQVAHGHPSDKILDLAGNMIVMSTHGRGGLSRLMYGSIADKVLRGARVPVALVRETTPGSDTTIRNIIVGLDGSELAETTLPIAMKLAKGANALISLMRVVEPYRMSPYMSYAPEMAYLPPEQTSELEEQMQSDARVYLEKVAHEIRKQDIRVVWEVRIGQPADEILRVAETTAADLILLSTHGRGGIRRWALGSVTDEVLHRGTIAILAIPPQMRRVDEQQLSNQSLTAH